MQIMTKSEEPEYTPLEFEEVDIEPVSQPLKRSPSILRVAIWLEVGHIIVFALLYALWHTSRIHYQWGYDGMPLKYNVSRTFTVDKQDLSLAKNTPAANDYWMNITYHRRNGLVSLSTDWTKKYELKPSGQKTKNGESVFQVDMFHQLHCLERIRGYIISAKYLYQSNPNRTEDDPLTKHTMHCVDYIRQAIMCTGDMTLVSTGKDIEFDHGPARQCRDFEAITTWVWAHKWDYETFLNGG